MSHSSAHPLVVRPQQGSVAAVGRSFVIREWSDPGPSYVHVHRSDDEAWHILEGIFRFHLPDGDVDAPAGTTVFVPAGCPHTYSVVEPGRYLIVLTPNLDRLIARLRALPDRSQIESVLAQHDTFIVNPARSAAAASVS
jgi:mannose-6-phosphate isomerase-like protein (cupin superfamily)